MVTMTRTEFLAATAVLILAPGRALASSAVEGDLVGLLPSRAQLWRWQQQEAGFCPIYTGSPGHKALVGWVEREFNGIGLTVSRQKFTFPYWEAKQWTLSVAGQNVPVSGYVPYSATTPAQGITAPLWDGGSYVSKVPPFGRVESSGYSDVQGKIVVTRVGDCSFAIGEMLQSANTFPPTENFPSVMHGPSNAFLGPDLAAMARAGAVGAINIWDSISDEAALDQIMPFVGPSIPIPGLWVSRSHGARLLAAMENGEPVTLTLRAETTPDTETETIWAVLPGSSDEVIIVNTHSDGANAYEENGPVNLVALAHAAARLPKSARTRTLVFLMATGHFSHGLVHGTPAWLEANPDIVKRAVACVSVEHLGGREWEEVGGHYRATGRPCWASAFTTTRTMERIFLQAAQASNLQRAVAMRPKARVIGEGSGFAAAGIPTIGYIEFAQWMFSTPRDAAIDKIDPDRLHHCLATLARTLTMIDRMPASELRDWT